ncbi:MAG: hypothetical protein U5L04_02045 [Trueperaceae bacterium]|nr:hypothetical protein [Trueperaceae bacterium]
MTWQRPIIDIRYAQLRAARAQRAGHWHLVVQHADYCLEQAEYADDRRAIRYFADKLSLAYRHMAMFDKAEHYRNLNAVR